MLSVMGTREARGGVTPFLLRDTHKRITDTNLQGVTPLCLREGVALVSASPVLCYEATSPLDCPVPNIAPFGGALSCV